MELQELELKNSWLEEIYGSSWGEYQYQYLMETNQHIRAGKQDSQHVLIKSLQHLNTSCYSLDNIWQEKHWNALRIWDI